MGVGRRMAVVAVVAVEVAAAVVHLQTAAAVEVAVAGLRPRAAEAVQRQSQCWQC